VTLVEQPARPAQTPRQYDAGQHLNAGETPALQACHHL
jgi:hypothetical protein